MKDSAVEVTIIVPVYKAQAYLQECIDSIAGQTFQNWECILVDDGSPDESGAICDRAAAADPRFRVIHKQNGGVSSARNAALDAARGEYIVFCDADDGFSPFALETALGLQTRHPRDFICWLLARQQSELPQTAAQAAQGGQKLYPAQKKQIYLITVQGHSNCNKLFRRSIIEKNSLRYNESLTMAEDYEFGNGYLDAFFAENPAAEIRQLELPLYFWRKNMESVSNKKMQVDPHTKVSYDPAEFPDYAAHMLAEYNQTKALANGWAGLSEEELLPQLHTFLNRFAFAVWVAHARKEPLLAGFLKSDEVKEVLALMKKHRAFSAYYLPFKLKNKWLLRRLYQSYQTGVRRLYSLMYTLGYYTLFLATGKRWKQP